MLASERSGAGAEEIFVPKLYYYEDLCFLAEPNESRPMSSVEMLQEGTAACSSSGPNSPAETPKPKKFKKNQAENNELLERVVRKIEGTDTQEDEAAIFGKCVATGIRNMSRKQVIIAKKLISQVIYHGELDELNVATILENTGLLMEVVEEINK